MEQVSVSADNEGEAASRKRLGPGKSGGHSTIACFGIMLPSLFTIDLYMMHKSQSAAKAIVKETKTVIDRKVSVATYSGCEITGRTRG